MSTFEKVKEAIVNTLQCDEDIVTPDASVKETLGADSLDILDLIMELEDAFDIKIESEKAQTIETVKDIVAVIDELTAA